MADSTPVDGVAVVVRSVGERTTALCTDLVRQQVGAARVTVIHEQPFSQAVRRCFEIGLDLGFDWTLALDADVLLLPNALRVLKTLAEDMPDHYFEFEADVLDKLFGRPRTGGPHLYRTSMLAEALPLISDAESVIRPESYMKRLMVARGHPFTFAPVLVGVHDYEQYFRDIYRKAFVHAHKHRHYQSYFNALWQRLSATDPDFLVARLGWQAGQSFDGAVSIDRRRFPSQLDVLLRAHDLQEKDDLTASLTEIEAAINTLVAAHELPPEYIAWQARQLQTAQRAEEYRLKRQALGKARFLVWTAGRGLQRVGRELVAWAERWQVQ